MNRLQALFRRGKIFSDLSEEIQQHLAEKRDALIAEGMSRKDAESAARREFGNLTGIEESGRDEWTWPIVDGVMADVRVAGRQMRHSPGFTLTAVFVLGLGVAANTIVFGVLQSLILQPLNVPHPDRVMTFARHDGGYPVASWPEVRDLNGRSRTLSAVAAEQMQVYGLEANGVTRAVWGDEVSGQFFEVMAIQPVLGRLLKRADDDHPGASEAVVLSWPAWHSYFGGDPNIVGKELRLNKRPYTIVGVTPQGFYGTQVFLQPDLFFPMANQAIVDGVDWLEDRRERNVFPIVRMKDGFTVAQVQAELDSVAWRIQRENPKEEDGVGFKLAPPGLIGNFVRRPALRFLAGVMGLAVIVMLAACANLGGLFAARTADRAREIAIRLAIGSNRWRIVRQLLVEAVVISVLGGSVACILSWLALTGLSQWSPPTDYPVRFLVMPQPSLFFVAFSISLTAGLLFGAAPLRQIFKADPNEAIRSGSVQGWRKRRWALRDILLAAQVTLCCITVTAAFVSLRGLGKSLAVEKGFNSRDTVLAKFDLAQAGYSVGAAEQLQRRILDRVLEQPGVVAAAYAHATPLADTPTVAVFPREATDLRVSKATFESFFYRVSPGYFAAAQARLLAGREIRESDTAKSPPVAVVNRQFAQHLFHSEARQPSDAWSTQKRTRQAIARALPGNYLEDVVGRYFKDNTGREIQIVGVMPDGKYFTLSEDPQEAAFFPILQQPSTATSLIVRIRPNSSAAAIAGMAAQVHELIRGVDPAIPIRLATSWENSLAFNLFPAQVATVALSLFGAFGLILSVTGIFGLASYTISKRMRELSIRVALGADLQQILSVAVGRLLLLIGSGAALGALLGAATSKILSAVVYQASAQDPMVLLAVAATILLTGLLSLAGPVRHAIRVDPATLLRDS